MSTNIIVLTLTLALKSALFKTWRGVFLKSYIFGLVAGAFYKRSNFFLISNQKNRFKTIGKRRLEAK